MNKVNENVALQNTEHSEGKQILTFRTHCEKYDILQNTLHINNRDPCRGGYY